MADEEQRLRDIQREYLDFLDDEVRFKVVVQLLHLNSSMLFAIKIESVAEFLRRRLNTRLIGKNERFVYLLKCFSLNICRRIKVHTWLW